MSGSKTRFVCQSCGRAAVKPLGRCPTCGEWNTYIEEEVESATRRRSATTKGAKISPRPLSQIEGGMDDERVRLSIAEFARDYRYHYSALVVASLIVASVEAIARYDARDQNLHITSQRIEELIDEASAK